MRNAPGFAVIKDPDGRILYVNQLFVDLWAVSPAQCVGKLDHELWPAEVAQQLRKHDLQVLGTGERMERVEYLPMPDGSVRKFQVIQFPYSGRDDRLFLGAIGIDITGRLDNEEELAKRVRQQGVIARLASQALFQSSVPAILDETTMLVSQVLEVEYCGYFDFSAGQPYLRAGVGWSETDLGAALTPYEGTQIAYTYQYEEPLRLSSLEPSGFVTPDLFAGRRIRASVTDVVRGRSEALGVLGAFTQSERAWSSDELSFLRTVGALMGGILMRFKVESALAESEATYRDLFQDAPAAYHELDSTGRICKVNRTECQLLGYTESELVGRPIWELVDQGQRADSEAAVTRKLNGTQQPAPLQRPYLRKDGTQILFQITERLIRQLGRITGICSIMVPVNGDPT